MLYATATVHAGLGQRRRGRAHPVDAARGHGRPRLRHRRPTTRTASGFRTPGAPTGASSGFAQVTLRRLAEERQRRLGGAARRAGRCCARRRSAAAALSPAGRAVAAYVFCDLRPHIVSLGNDGLLRTDGTYGTSQEDVRRSSRPHIPKAAKGWRPEAPPALRPRRPDRRGRPRCSASPTTASALLEAAGLSGGLHLEDGLLDDAHQHPPGRGAPPPAGGRPRRHQGLHARPPGRRARAGRAGLRRQGRVERDEGERAARDGAKSADPSGPAARASPPSALAELVAGGGWEVHVVGHSAGSIFHAPLVQKLATKGRIAGGPLAGEDGLGVPIRDLHALGAGLHGRPLRADLPAAASRRRGSSASRCSR